MRTLYIDCGMGAAGDMLTASLIELLPDSDSFVQELNSLNIPGVEYIKEPSVKCGITGTHMTVRINGTEEGEHIHEHEHEHGHSHEHDHEHSHHHHSSLADIKAIVDSLNVPQTVKEDVMAVYMLIAEAESHAHGKEVTEIHFHEVGSMDAIADVTAVCLLMNKIAPDKVVVSPVHVGSGHVHCAHGILPVPAPATAYILKDAPIYGGGVKGELCTPTGAALLKYYATEFGSMPVMRVSAIGYGMGKKDFKAANCVRSMLGETSEDMENIYELSFNVDDMTGEQIGFCMESLFEAGAREVFTSSVGMKKSRPGTLITVLCDKDKKAQIVENVFKNSTTIGIREHEVSRYTLNRRIETKNTPLGDIRVKISEGYGVVRQKFEYEDLSKLAKDNNLSIEEVRRIVEK